MPKIEDADAAQTPTLGRLVPRHPVDCHCRLPPCFAFFLLPVSISDTVFLSMSIRPHQTADPESLQ